MKGKVMPGNGAKDIRPAQHNVRPKSMTCRASTRLEKVPAKHVVQQRKAQHGGLSTPAADRYYLTVHRFLVGGYAMLREQRPMHAKYDSFMSLL